MKKYLYLLPLLVLILIPTNVFAFSSSNTDLVLFDSGLTDSQKQDYLAIIKESSYFIDNVDNYSYYIISYNYDRPYQYKYKDVIIVSFYNDLPVPTTFGSQLIIDYSFPVYEFRYNISSNTFVVDFHANYRIRDYVFLGIEGANTYDFVLYSDYILESNFPIYYPFDFNLYDTSYNLIGSYTTEDDITKLGYTDEMCVKEYTIEDILNSDDVIYSLSKELIGPLPEEFQFIYSVVSLMLGVLILIVIISPFVLLKRWLM